MLFNSTIFLLYALPTFLVGYFLIGRTVNHRAAMIWLIGASLLFYGSWDPAALFLLCGSALFNFSVGQLLMSPARTRPLRLALLWGGLAFNVALLCYFKYTGFIITNLNAAAGLDVVYPAIILPLAISFFTFQKIAYLVDAYRNKAQRRDFVSFLLFVFFFPQLIAGPIVHHSEVMPQFETRDAIRPDYRNLAVGIVLFLIGLVKKVAFADTLANYTTNPFQAAYLGWELSFFEAWAAVLGFSYQIYFDFSGYSDMALGVALMFNIRLPINFSSPFKATSIIDFWRRWHMTLTRFLTDYVYTPLSLALTRRTASKRLGKWLTFALTIAVPVNVTFLVSGIWHGAGWNYVLFGVVNGVGITINSLWRAAKLPALPKVLGWLMTMAVFTLSIACFRAQSLGAAQVMIDGMLGRNGIMLPAAAKTWFGPLGDYLASAGWRFDDTVLAYFKWPAIGIWLACLTILLLTMPNGQDLLKPFKPALDSRPSDLVAKTVLGIPLSTFYSERAMAILWPLRWPAGVVVAGLALTAIFYQSFLRETIPEFIYFQF